MILNRPLVHSDVSPGADVTYRRQRRWSWARTCNGSFCFEIMSFAIDLWILADLMFYPKFVIQYLVVNNKIMFHSSCTRRMLQHVPGWGLPAARQDILTSILMSDFREKKEFLVDVHDAAECIPRCETAGMLKSDQDWDLGRVRIFMQIFVEPSRAFRKLLKADKSD